MKSRQFVYLIVGLFAVGIIIIVLRLKYDPVFRKTLNLKPIEITSIQNNSTDSLAHIKTSNGFDSLAYYKNLVKQQKKKEDSLKVEQKGFNK